MFSATSALRQLSTSVRDTERRPASDWIFDPPGWERELEVSDGLVRVHFPHAPVAASLAATVGTVDLEARRAATALQRRLHPEQLRGRGTRLIPPREGLVVDRADPGSLDVALLLGGLYTIVTSQPVSFALNFGELIGLGQLAVKAVLPGGKEESSEVVVSSESGTFFGTKDRQQLIVPTPHGILTIPEDASVEIEMDFFDGTKLRIKKSR
jgi:hypothetical protein